MSTRDSQSFSILINYIYPETCPSTELTGTGWPVYKLAYLLLAAKTGNLFPMRVAGTGWSIKHILHIFVPNLMNVSTETPTTSVNGSELLSHWLCAARGNTPPLTEQSTSGSVPPIPPQFTVASLSSQNTVVEEAEKCKQLFAWQYVVTQDYRYTVCLHCDFLRKDNQNIDFPITRAVKTVSLFM